MGSWDESCRLTHVGIGSGDACVRVRVVVPEGKLPQLHQLIATGEFPWSTQWRWIKSIDFGHYDDYGRMKEDLGVDQESDHTIWFHQAAWDWAVEWAKADIDEPMNPRWWGGETPDQVKMWQNIIDTYTAMGKYIEPHILDYVKPWPERIGELLCVLRAGRWTRRNIWAYERGPQCWFEEWEANLELQRLSTKLLGKPLLKLHADMIADGDDPDTYPFNKRDPRKEFPSV